MQKQIINMGKEELILMIKSNEIALAKNEITLAENKATLAKK